MRERRVMERKTPSDTPQSERGEEEKAGWVTPGSEGGGQDVGGQRDHKEKREIEEVDLVCH